MATMGAITGMIAIIATGIIVTIMTGIATIMTAAMTVKTGARLVQRRSELRETMELWVSLTFPWLEESPSPD